MPHLPLEDIVRHNLDLFAEKDTDLGKTQTIKMTIDTGGHPPIRLKPYRTPFSKRATVDKAIDDMLAANIIQPSRSPWSFAVVVDKKDGSKRSAQTLGNLTSFVRSQVGHYQ